MNSTESNLTPHGRTEPKVIVESFPTLTAKERDEYISTAAYYKAEARAFAAGQEMDDWLEAETEFENRPQA